MLSGTYKAFGGHDGHIGDCNNFNRTSSFLFIGIRLLTLILVTFRARNENNCKSLDFAILFWGLLMINTVQYTPKPYSNY